MPVTKSVLESVLAEHFRRTPVFGAASPAPGWQAAVVSLDAYDQPVTAQILAINDEGRPIALRLTMSQEAAGKIKGFTSLLPSPGGVDLEDEGELANGIQWAREPNLRVMMDHFGLLRDERCDWAFDSAETLVFHAGADRPEFRDEDLRRKISGIEAGRAADAVAAVRPFLTAEVKDLLAHLETFDTQTWGFYSVDGEEGLRRRQAAQVYPSLSALLARPRFRKIHRVIRDGAPLALAIEEFMQVPQKHLRRLQGMAWSTEGLDEAEMLDILCACPPDWAPKDEREFSAFCDVAAVLPALSASTRQTADVLLNGCAGRWVEFRDRMLDSIDVPVPGDAEDQWAAREEEIAHLKAGPAAARRENLMQAARNCVDVGMSFADTIVGPCVAWQASVEGAYDVFVNDRHRAAFFDIAMDTVYGGKAAPACLEISRRWHHAATIYEVEDEIDPREAARALVTAAWPTLPAVRAPNGLFMVPLNTTEMVQEEGRRQGHCVYQMRYDRKCRSQGHHLMSIREGGPDGPSIVTIEFGSIDAGVARLATKQVQGSVRINRAVRDDANAAVTWYMQQIRTGALPVDMKQILFYRQQMQQIGYTAWNYQGGDDAEAARVNGALPPQGVASAAVVQHQCGYDWRDPRLIIQEFRKWGDKIDLGDGKELPAILGKQFRKMGAKGFVASEPVLRVAHQINPGLKAVMAAAPARQTPYIAK